MTPTGSTTLREDGHEVAVDLDSGDRRAGLGQRERQRAEAGADLDDLVAGADAGEAGDAADGVGIGDEVLAERPARMQAVTLEQFDDVSVAEQLPVDADVDHAGRQRGEPGERLRRQVDDVALDEGAAVAHRARRRLAV